MAPASDAAFETNCGSGFSIPFASHSRSASACCGVGAAPAWRFSDLIRREKACELMTARLNQVPTLSSS